MDKIKWTPELEKKAVEMYVDGGSLSKIVRYFLKNEIGRTCEGTVKKRIGKHIKPRTVSESASLSHRKRANFNEKDILKKKIAKLEKQIESIIQHSHYLAGRMQIKQGQIQVYQSRLSNL